MDVVAPVILRDVDNGELNALSTSHGPHHFIREPDRFPWDHGCNHGVFERREFVRSRSCDDFGDGSYSDVSVCGSGHKHWHGGEIREGGAHDRDPVHSGQRLTKGESAIIPCVITVRPFDTRAGDDA